MMSAAEMPLVTDRKLLKKISETGQGTLLLARWRQEGKGWPFEREEKWRRQWDYHAMHRCMLWGWKVREVKAGCWRKERLKPLKRKGWKKAWNYATKKKEKEKKGTCDGAEPTPYHWYCQFWAKTSEKKITEQWNLTSSELKITMVQFSSFSSPRQHFLLVTKYT